LGQVSKAPVNGVAQNLLGCLCEGGMPMTGYLGRVSGILLALVLPMTTSASDRLSATEVESLLNDKTWEMHFIMSQKRATYWDWRRDGTLCARVLGAPQADKCADEGRWRIEDNAICWKLTWFGGDTGLKAQCIHVRRGENGRFDAVRVTAKGAKYFEFLLVN